MEGSLDLGRVWGEEFPAVEDRSPQDRLEVRVTRAEDAVEIVVPAEMTAGNPEVLAFEWD